MKVVLFCGGMGTRLKDYSERIPKPLVEVGNRPILWHLMKYYAHYGHKEFILCLGHGARAIKEFFLKYDQCQSSDFVLSEGGRKVSLLDRDIQDWKITFVDTGLHSNVGERLRCVREYIEGDELFLANYADALCDLDLNAYIENFRHRNKVACFMSVPAPHTFHIVHSDAEYHATKLELVTRSPVRINGGFFVFRNEFFEYLQPGEELVVEPFARLMEKRQLLAVPHTGFWRNMDTFKDKMELDDLLNHGRGPWQVWQKY
ncbi:MAG TPA: sugar phosphate nucleotidyltransferase [Polyangiales bacterium]|nr:sugar phosphate nucleotidyltransferase [Polyangiales bacterium]